MTHIAVDLDDCILDFAGNLKKIINREYATALTDEDFSDWNIGSVINPILGEDWWEWWRRRYWLWAKADAVPGAIGGLEELRRRGHFLEIVTAKPRWAEPLTWQWLGKWQPPVHRVTLVELGVPKWAATDAEMIVDDKPSTVIDWVNSEPDRRGILFTWRYYRSTAEPTPRVTQVNSWRAILEELQ